MRALPARKYTVQRVCCIAGRTCPVLLLRERVPRVQDLATSILLAVLSNPICVTCAHDFIVRLEYVGRVPRIRSYTCIRRVSVRELCVRIEELRKDIVQCRAQWASLRRFYEQRYR